MKISVSPPREHDFSGFEGLKIDSKTNKNRSKNKTKKCRAKEREKKIKKRGKREVKERKKKEKKKERKKRGKREKKERQKESEKKKEKREGREGGRSQLPNLALQRYLYKGRLHAPLPFKTSGVFNLHAPLSFLSDAPSSLFIFNIRAISQNGYGELELLNSKLQTPVSFI